MRMPEEGKVVSGHVRAIAVSGSGVLRRAGESVEEDYPDLEQLIADMFVTMRRADGVGLAAPQIGLSLRLFVLDASPYGEDHPELAGFRRVVINPEILEFSEDEVTMVEGCLSVPGINERVTRAESVRVRYQNERMEWVEETLEGMPARIFQHEYDHLEGKLFTDRVSPMMRRMLKGKLKRLARGDFEAGYEARIMREERA